MSPNFLYRIINLIFLIFIYGNSIAQTTVTYQSSPDDFANPERGFYRYSETRSSNYTLLDQSELTSYRSPNTPPGAGYSIYSTLVFRYFFLEDFKSSEISQAYLDNMQTDFNTARAAGVKLIPRFAYTDEVDGTGCSSFICPPYGDASKTWILTHINQLATLLEDNKDVIAVVQMGLVGVWGENYYTDFFGDASQGPNFKLVDQNWLDRIEVLNALLAAVPGERMVQVRYPQQKQRAIYGINATTDVAPLTLAEAFSGNSKARIGFHNDCLLASADDFGTFTDYGNTASGSTSDTTNLKPYFASDSKFVAVGGETCSDGYTPQNDCASSDPSAYGDTELKRLHYSYLNSQYNNDVNNDWVTGGCMEEIKKELGYRFELQDGLFSDSAQPDQVFDINLNLENTGYASPYNDRGVELMLRNTTTSIVWFVALPDDPRFWFGDNSVHTISETICIPTEMPLGDYEVLLNLPDPMPTLSADPAYSIRLATLLPDNSDVWEPSTGYNNLGHTITIDNISSNSNCNGELTLAPLNVSVPVTLVNFKAIPNDKNIEINWSTSAEINNDGFHVERSTDGENFRSIKWQKGQGTTNNLTHYSMVDSDVNPNKDYYYRLAQKDFDGAITYSKIVVARLNKNEKFVNSIQIYPNPSREKITINWDHTLAEIMEIRILNLYGQEVLQTDLNSNIVDIGDLPAGLYFVRLRSADNEFFKNLVKW